MVTLFYTKIHSEFFIFLGVALHYTIYHIKNSINIMIRVIFDIDRMCHLKHSDLPQAKEITKNILDFIINNKSSNKE